METLKRKNNKNPGGDDSVVAVYDLRFPLQRNMIVSGPSCAGKSVFVMQLLQHADTYFHPPPTRIFWYYGEVQPSNKCNDKIIYRRGLPTEQEVNSFHECIIVLDDLMWESRSNMEVANLFTRVAHHKMCFVIHITQNLFQGGLVTRTQSLNAHYFVLFKNPRDRLQLSHLARQIYPGNIDFLLAAFDDATTNRDYGYLLLDLGPTTKEKIRIRSDIFLENKQISVYAPPPSSSSS
jgi:hypothetical protein